MRILVLVVLGLFVLSVNAKTMSLTFDDGVNPDVEPRASAWNGQLLDGLKQSSVHSMIFPSLKLVGGVAGQQLIMNWSLAGHQVGNHTSKHRNFASSKLSLDDFISDVKENDQVFNRYPNWVPMLRFPYLKEGDTLQKRDGMRSWLSKNKYRPAPVSIVTSDWYFNEVWLQLQEAGSAQKPEGLKQVYISHLLSRAHYYDALALDTIKRSPSHVMLLHVSAINAACIVDIVKAFQMDGWQFITPAAAFEDNIYKDPPNVLPAGESVVWSLAKLSGAKDLRYPAEDSVYEEAGLRAKGLIPYATIGLTHGSSGLAPFGCAGPSFHSGPGAAKWSEPLNLNVRLLLSTAVNWIDLSTWSNWK